MVKITSFQRRLKDRGAQWPRRYRRACYDAPCRRLEMERWTAQANSYMFMDEEATWQREVWDKFPDFLAEVFDLPRGVITFHTHSGRE